MKWILGIVTLLIMVAAVAVFVIPAKAPSTDPTTPAHKDDLIELASPLPQAEVSSPLIAHGRARGMWYFEASFPVELRDASGAMIAQGYAQAQGEWMTEEYVPFESIPLNFAPQPAGSVGTLVLKKDNPSGLPEHDNELIVPIVFR